MKLHRKLELSFLAALLLPVLIMMLVLWALSYNELSIINERYDTNLTLKDLLITDGGNLVQQSTQDALRIIYDTEQDAPARLEQKTFLDELSESLDEHNSYVLLYKNGVNVYNGINEGKRLQENPDISKEGLAKYWYDALSKDSNYLILTWDSEVKSHVQKIQFKCEDGSTGILLVVTMANQLCGEWRNLIIQFLLASVLAIIGIVIVVSAIMYRAIYKPLSRLREGTKNITDGNLEFSLKASSKDEFGDLCRDFEKMRIQLKESKEQHDKDESMNRELISNISHDLKTPITSIKGYVEGIMDGIADTPEKMNRYIRTIYTKTVTMTQLLDELTYYSKIDSNRIPYTFTKIDIVGYFLDCAEDVDDTLAAENIRFMFENTCSPPIYVEVDAEQLRKVINNIISNSIKYMDKPPG